MAAENPQPARGRQALRVVSSVVALGLALWSLSDDALIGGGPGFGLTQGVVLLVAIGLAGSCLLPAAWNGRALALVISIGFVLVVTEVGLRVVFSSRYRGANELDPDALYRLVPGATRQFQRDPVNGGERIFYRVNSQGFRGEELETDPEFRVVVYGDSFIQAEYSTLENSFAERLERRLSEALGREVEVVNAGVAGYGPDQALKRMERELASLEPDLLIAAIFSGNDFGDPVRNKLFRFDDDGSLQAASFEVDPALRREMEVKRSELILKRIARDAILGLLARADGRSSPTEELEAMAPRERLEYFREGHIREYEEYLADDRVRELRWDSYDADVSLTPDHESARFKAQLMDAIVGRMKQVADEVAVPIVLLPIPHPIDVGGHDSGEVDREKYPDYRDRYLIELLEASAARHGIPAVDLYGPFQELGTDAVYFRGFDDHWNDRGQDVAARVVTDMLVRTVLATSVAGDR